MKTCFFYFLMLCSLHATTTAEPESFVYSSEDGRVYARCDELEDDKTNYAFYYTGSRDKPDKKFLEFTDATGWAVEIGSYSSTSFSLRDKIVIVMIGPAYKQGDAQEFANSTAIRFYHADKLIESYTHEEITGKNKYQYDKNSRDHRHVFKKSVGFISKNAHGDTHFRAIGRDDIIYDFDLYGKLSVERDC